MPVNYCDHDHETRDEIRKLPTGGGANALLCRKHFGQQMAFRRAEDIRLGRIPEQQPTWNELEVTSAAIPSKEDSIRHAAKQYHSIGSFDGDIEIDENAVVRAADGGHWVQAWLWLPQQKD